MTTEAIRTIEEIVSDVQEARIAKVKLGYTLEGLADDINIVTVEMTKDLAKFTVKGNKAAGKRVRTYTKVLETLGKEFRLESVK